MVAPAGVTPAFSVEARVGLPASTGEVTLEWASGAGAVTTDGQNGFARLLRTLGERTDAEAFEDSIVLRDAARELDRAVLSFRDCDRVAELGLDWHAVRRMSAERSFDYGRLSLETHSNLGFLGCHFSELPSGRPPAGQVFVQLSIDAGTRSLAFRLAGEPLMPQSVHFSERSLVWQVALLAPVFEVGAALGRLDVLDAGSSESLGSLQTSEHVCGFAFGGGRRGAQLVSVVLDVGVDQSPGPARDRVSLGYMTQCLFSDGVALSRFRD